MKPPKLSKKEAVVIGVILVVAFYDQYFGIFRKPSTTHKR